VLDGEASITQFRKFDPQIPMFPSYPTSNMRFEMVKRELYVDKIKANKCGIWPLARCVNGPHADLCDSSKWPEQNKTKNDIPRNRGPKLVVVDNWVQLSSSAGRRKGFSTGNDLWHRWHGKTQITGQENRLS
jgi:hypothetical protein